MGFVYDFCIDMFYAQAAAEVTTVAKSNNSLEPSRDSKCHRNCLAADVRGGLVAFDAKKVPIWPFLAVGPLFCFLANHACFDRAGAFFFARAGIV